MKRTYYKVVRLDPLKRNYNSARIINCVLKITYNLNKTVKPKPLALKQGYGICVFARLRDAKEFAFPCEPILRCHGKKLPNKLPPMLNCSGISALVAKQPFRPSAQTWPEGTVMLSECTPYSVVQNKTKQ